MHEISYSFEPVSRTLEREPADRILEIVDGPSDAQFHVTGGDFVDDVLGVAEGTCLAVEFGDDQRVAVAVRGQ